MGGFLSIIIVSGSVFYVGANIFQLGEDFRKETGIRVDSQHGWAQLVDNVDASVPKSILVRLHEERLQGIAYFVSHVTASKEDNWEKEKWVVIEGQ